MKHKKKKFLLHKNRKTQPLEYANVNKEWNSFTAVK